MSSKHQPVTHPILTMTNPTELYNPKPFAYSHITQVQHFSRIIHISGQGGENAQGLLSNDFVQQLEQVLQNINHALSAVNANFDDIAILRVLIVNHNAEKHQLLIQKMQSLWKNQEFPACTLIPVPCLALADMQIEIEATAYCL